MTPDEYFKDSLAHAESLFGPRSKKWDSVEIAFDSPDGTPRTYYDEQARKVKLSLNDYASNYEHNEAFVDEVGHETIHTLSPGVDPQKTLRLEEGLGEWFTLQHVAKNFPNDDRNRRRNYHLNGIHGESLRLIEQIQDIPGVISKIRESDKSLSEVSKDDLVLIGISKDVAKGLVEFAYPQPNQTVT